MDDLDRKILFPPCQKCPDAGQGDRRAGGADQPAVSSRIHKLETDGIISGYTVVLNRPADRVYVDALISLSVTPATATSWWS